MDGGSLSEGCDISVVIPVYNSRPYLQRCLRSVLEQAIGAIEIVAVDDGSTDGSRDALAAASAADPRIRVIGLPENMGQGPARNRGIQMARGRYVAFLDSDDAMAPASLSRMLKLAEADDVDIVLGAYDRYREQSRGSLLLEPRAPAIFGEALRRTNVVAHPDLVRLSACWQGVYRRSFLLDRGLTFKRRRYEDFDFLLDCLVQARSISFLPDIYIWNIARFVLKDELRSVTQRRLSRDDLELLLAQLKRVESILSERSKQTSLALLAPARQIVMRRYLERFAREIFPVVAAQYDEEERRIYYDEVGAIFRANADAFDDYRMIDRRAALTLELLLQGLHASVDEVATDGAIGEAAAAEILIQYPRLRVVLKDLVEDRPSIIAPAPKSVPAIIPRGIGRTLLHIGAPKAGSTYIQNFLEWNRAKLLVRGILYPKHGIFREDGFRKFRTAGHEALVGCLKTGDMEPLLGYRREIEGAGEVDTVILSAENLFRVSTTKAVETLSKALVNTCTTIVVYLRRQDEWIESMFVEWVTGGHWRTTESFEEYLRDQEAAGSLDYSAIIERWADRFGSENILVRPFEAGRLHGNPARDFLALCSIDAGEGLFDPDEASANRFFGSGTDVEVLRFFNRLPFSTREHYLEFVGQYYNWRAKGGEEFPRPLFLDPTARRSLLARYAEGNERIAREYLGTDETKPFVMPMTEREPEKIVIAPAHLEQAFVFYHNSKVQSAMAPSNTGAVRNQGPVPKIIGFGPNPVTHRLPFNQQPNGASAIWVKTDPNPSAGDSLVFGDTRLRTVVGQEVLTAELPQRLFEVPRSVPLCVETLRGGQKVRSAAVDFEIK